MTWCWLTLLLTGITPLNVWADSDIYNKPIEQTQDVSQPGEDVFILHNTWINFTDDPADMGTLLCFSESNPAMVHVLRAVTGLLGITLLIQSG